VEERISFTVPQHRAVRPSAPIVDDEEAKRFAAEQQAKADLEEPQTILRTTRSPFNNVVCSERGRKQGERCLFAIAALHLLGGVSGGFAKRQWRMRSPGFPSIIASRSQLTR